MATLLEYSPNFRKHFYDKCGLTEHVDKFEVKTEERGIDILITYPNHIILIENKVNSGALQIDQLTRYYQNTKKKNKQSRIFVILITPTKNCGQKEVNRLKEFPDFSKNDNDKVSHISWKDIIEYNASENDEKEFIESGFECIKNLIKRGPLTPRYENVWEITNRVLDNLESEYSDQFRLDLKRYNKLYNIYPKSPFKITFYLDTEIENDNNIVISTKFKLSGVGKGNKILKSKWEEFCKQKEVQIEGIGQHKLDEEGWFIRNESFGAINNNLENKLEDYGKKLIDYILGILKSWGIEK